MTGDEDVNYSGSRCWRVNETAQLEPALLQLNFTSKNSAQIDLNFRIDSKLFTNNSLVHT